MTDVPVDDPETLRHILANTEALLLDFDGPICSVFAGFPANAVADQLRKILTEESQLRLPGNVINSEDPFDVLKFATTLGERESRYIEAAFRAHELEAITTATPTPYASELIQAWHSSGRRLGVVSNNGVDAIRSYLIFQGLDPYIEFIAGRTGSNVAALKPDPYLINTAVATLEVQRNVCSLIGDSETDIKAAHAASIRPIGYANKEGKIQTLTRANSAAIISTMEVALMAIQSR